MKKSIIAYTGGIVMGLIGAGMAFAFGSDVGTSIGIGYIGVFCAYNTIINYLND